MASATIPGAALLVVGLVLALRGPLPRGLERLLGGREPSGGAGAGAAGTGAAATPGAAGTADRALWRVPDGRYLHTERCPLLDGRTDLIPAGSSPATQTTQTVDVAEAAEETAGAAEAGLRPCPLCRGADRPDAAAAPGPAPAPAPAGSDRGR